MVNKGGVNKAVNKKSRVSKTLVSKQVSTETSILSSGIQGRYPHWYPRNRPLQTGAQSAVRKLVRSESGMCIK